MPKKNNKNNQLVGLVNGSMAVAKQAAKVKNVMRKRWFMQSLSELTTSQQVLSSSQSPFPVGSQFSAGTILFSASELSNNATEWIQKADKFRITSVEVFVTLVSRIKGGGNVDKTIPVEIYFYEDTDADPATQTSWIRTSDRDNLGRVVLHATNPSMRLITFKPTVSLAASTDDQSPSNIVPTKNQWLDALSLNQLHSGVRWFSATPQLDTSGQSFEYSLAFSYRYCVEVCQPI